MYLWYSEGKYLSLFKGEKIISIDIGQRSENDNGKKRDGAGAVCDQRGKRKNDWYPIDDIVCHKNQVQGMTKPEFNRTGTG